MSRVYTPDSWRVVEFTYGDEKEPLRKVFAGWYGGFTQGDSWKLSSGIIKTTEFDNRYEFENHSGSTYVCFKAAQRMSGYMMQVYSSFEAQVDEAPDVTMKLIDYKE